MLLMRGENISAVSWTNECGGREAPEFVLSLMGRMKTSCGWHHVARHIPG